MNNDSYYPCSCLMKLDLLKTADKLAFLKDNWPSFGQLENIEQLSEKELRCTLCLLDVLIDALAKEEIYCPNREIIRLVITRTYAQNCFDICKLKELAPDLIFNK